MSPVSLRCWLQHRKQDWYTSRLLPVLLPDVLSVWAVALACGWQVRQTGAAAVFARFDGRARLAVMPFR